jgi:ABC-type Mn2+/Zn2+ transport system ATPase subunit
MRIIVENLSYSYNENKILEDIFLHVTKGEFVGLIYI